MNPIGGITGFLNISRPNINHHMMQIFNWYTILKIKILVMSLNKSRNIQEKTYLYKYQVFRIITYLKILHYH